MAKLSGVTTVDMVNGEITKVAYDGAEYVKTDASVKEGDLFQLREGHRVIGGEVGAFYPTSTYRDGAIVIPTECVGDATYTQSKGWGVAYRKISATTPTIEERVTAIEQAQASLEADVSALKGEDKAFKAGDKVRVISENVSAMDAKVGDVLTVTKVWDDGDFEVYDTDGEELLVEGEEEAKCFELITEATPVTPKVGDIVTFEGFDGEYRKVDRKAQAGDVVVFRENTFHRLENGKPYEVTKDKYGLSVDDEWCLYQSDFGRTPQTIDVYEKVAEAKAYEPKVGDIVVTLENRPNAPIDSIGKVSKLSSDGSFRVHVPGYGNIANWFDVESIRPATAEEIAEYEASIADAQEIEKWAKIGRKVNELRKGDIIRILNRCGAPLTDGRLIEVAYDSVVESANAKGGWHVVAELVAPVESTLN